jgi:hypothetical protein
VHSSNLSRIAFAVFADFCINTAILMVSYPILERISIPARYSAEYWFRVYLSAAFFTTIAALLVGVVTAWSFRAGSTRRAVIVQVVATFILLSALAVYADFSEPDPASSWPNLIQQIAAKFFAELQSIKFVADCASSMSIAAGLLVALLFRRKPIAQA